MKNILIILIVAAMLAVAGWYYMNHQKAQPESSDSLKQLDEQYYQLMKSMFQSADTSGQFTWIAGLVQDYYTGAKPMLPEDMVNGQRTKTRALNRALHSAFLPFAQGGEKAADGTGYTIGGGYSRKTLGDALHNMAAEFKTKALSL